MSEEAPMSERWEEITVNKLGPAPNLGLGRSAKPDHLGRDRRKMPLAASGGAQHARCVDHVKVDGLAGKLCILKGQDPEAVIAEARELAGGG